MQRNDSLHEIDPFFELDFATCCNLMLGQRYDQAVKSAEQWLKERKDDSSSSI